MDVVAHGLWSYQLVGRRSQFLPAVIWGVAPDLFAFAPFFLGRILQGRLIFTKPALEAIPDYVFRLYDISHSLILAASVLVLIKLLRGSLPWPLLAWPLHILFDIPTHSTAFFPTPFLWPVSHLKVNGVAWSTPWVMFVNYSVLIGLFVLQTICRRKRQRTG